MSAYRDEVAALRHRLELETARADRAQDRLDELTKARDERWSGDVALFLARFLLLVVPAGYLMFFVTFFGTAFAFNVFNDVRGLVALLAFLVSPLFVAGPLAASKTATPSRMGWGLALFANLYMLALMPPAALFGLAVFLRGRSRDAVFGAPIARVRVAVGEDALEQDALEADGPALGEEDAELRTSRSAHEAS